MTPRGTVAADPKYRAAGRAGVPQARPPEASGLWVAQDTGGAIKGPNRFDTFWGAGTEAATMAGGHGGVGAGAGSCCPRAQPPMR